MTRETVGKIAADNTTSPLRDRIKHLQSVLDAEVAAHAATRKTNEQLNEALKDDRKALSELTGEFERLRGYFDDTRTCLGEAKEDAQRMRSERGEAMKQLVDERARVDMLGGAVDKMVRVLNQQQLQSLVLELLK